MVNKRQNSIPDLNTNSSARSSNSGVENDVVEIARGGGIAFIGNTSTRALSYLYNLALIWGLGVEQFGLFTLAMTIVNFIGLLSNLGLPLGIIRFGAMNVVEQGISGIHRVIRTALSVSIPTTIIFAMATFLCAEPISSKLFHKPELTLIIQSLSWGIPFIALESIFLAATRALKEMKYTTIVSIIQPLFALVVAVVFVKVGMGVNGAVLAYNASFIIGSAFSVFYYFRLIPRNFQKVTGVPVGPLLKFSLPLSVTEWMHYANERTEVFFLGLLPGAAAISIYKIAWSLAGLETLLRLSLEQILAPFSSDLTHRKEIGQLESLYKATAKWGFSFGLMLFFLFLLFGKELMSLFNLNEAMGVTVLVILAAAQLFNEFTGACNTILIMSGRSDLTMLNTILLLGINIGLNWWLILKFGLLGAAIAGAAAVVIINTLRVLEVWWTLKVHPIKASFIIPVLIGIAAALIAYFVDKNLFQDTIIMKLLSAIIFCVLFLLGSLNFKLDPEDRYVLVAIRNKITKRRASSATPSH